MKLFLLFNEINNFFFNSFKFIENLPFAKKRYKIIEDN